jgi:hypothetical protein
MGIRDWFKHRNGERGDAMETVPFLDTATGKVVQIPAAELRPGAVQARVEGVDGVVWIMADEVKPGEIRHPPFSEEIRAYVRRIREAFAEHRPLTLEEWEEGFRRDLRPSHEIALWLHAADVYEEFAADEPSPLRREDVYATIVACLNASPEGVWHVLETAELSREEAQRVIDRYYGKAP